MKSLTHSCFHISMPRSLCPYFRWNTPPLFTSPVTSQSPCTTHPRRRNLNNTKAFIFRSPNQQRMYNIISSSHSHPHLSSPYLTISIHTSLQSRADPVQAIHLTNKTDHPLILSIPHHRLHSTDDLTGNIRSIIRINEESQSDYYVESK